MSKEDDQEKRSKVMKAIETTLKKASKNDVGDPDSVREKNPALADVLDEFILSKSWRTDPTTTAKQVAEVVTAKEPASKLALLIGELEEELKSPRGS